MRQAKGLLYLEAGRRTLASTGRRRAAVDTLEVTLENVRHT